MASETSPARRTTGSARSSRRGILMVLAGAALVTALVLVSQRSERAPEGPELGPFPAAEVSTERFDITLGINPTELTDEQLEAALDLAASANVTQIQSGATWWYLNRGRAPREYDWTDLDRLLAATEARGMRVVLRLSGTPLWVHGDEADRTPTREEIWSPPVESSEQLEHWGDFVADVVGRYGGRIAFYELWNEPNSYQYWQPEPSPAAFADLMRTGYLRAKDADPDVLVGTGGVSRNDVGFLEAYYEQARRRHDDAEANGHFFDILGVHPYSGEVPPGVVSGELVTTSEFGLLDKSFLGFTRMHEVLARHGEGDKPIYLGEYGFSTIQTWMAPVPEETRADYLVEAFDLALGYRYLIGMNWYDFLPFGSEEGWAIVDDDGEPLPTFDALREVGTRLAEGSP